MKTQHNNTLNLFALFAVFFFVLNPSMAQSSNTEYDKGASTVRYGKENVEGLDIFYREAGNPAKQALVLLHGFPHSSHMYRKVLSGLGDSYHIIAPDYPGFGDSSFPSPSEYSYTFDNIAETINQFLIQRKIDNYVLMLHDYGAPIGFRIATKAPDKVKGLVIMNGNIYNEGFNQQAWSPIMQYWKNKDNPELEQAIAAQIFSDAGLQWQYTHGTRQPDNLVPDSWNLDILKFAREGQHRMQLDLFYDYQNNVKLFPVWQQYLRDNQPPVLIVWGKNDAFFPVSGAEAYKRDIKEIDYHLLDTGHFPLEEDSTVIIQKMRTFLSTKTH